VSRATVEPSRWAARRTGGKPRIKVNTELRFYHEVLGLRYLHYGMWDGEPLTLAGLQAAQARYARTLCDWIPAGVRRILDVGCGTGETALALQARGFEVEGLSPDPYQEEVFTRRTGLPFHLTRFQEHDSERGYDLAMFSESAQYIHLHRLFAAARRLVPGGFLLVCDYFWRPDAPANESPSGHRLDEFLAEAARHGFAVERREDITDRVLPTLDLAHGWVERHVVPTVQIVLDWLAYRRPGLFRLGRRWIVGQAAKLARLQAKLDSGAFRRSKTYEILLFRQREGAAAAGQAEPGSRRIR
jgi:MPBQ/MSBQ methyltransferase